MERFLEGVRCVDNGVDPLELDDVVFNPLLDCEMADIHVTGALRWLAGVGRAQGTYVISADQYGVSLWNL
jgi:hypothetical protein